MAKAKTPKKKPEFAITLTIGSDVYKGEGASPQEALASLPKPAKIMAKGTVTAKQGNLTKSMLLSPVKIKQLFFKSAGVQQIIAKQLFTLIK